MLCTWHFLLTKESEKPWIKGIDCWLSCLEKHMMRSHKKDCNMLPRTNIVLLELSFLGHTGVFTLGSDPRTALAFIINRLFIFTLISASLVATIASFLMFVLKVCCQP